MIKIHMFSSATKVAGQGVGSAYTELMGLLKRHFPDQFDVRVNDYSASDISHYHTIDPQFFLTMHKKKRGRRIGYVHFLPETLKGSLSIPWPADEVFYKYVIAFYKAMDQLVVVNPSFIPKLADYGISASTVEYIPNFVSQQDFYAYTPDQKQTLRAQLGIPASKFVVFGNGQVQERKGVRDFITLAQTHPDVQFIWAGGFSFGRLTDGYEGFKKAIDNAPQNLTFTGIIPREKMRDYYNVADLFLLPSYDELFPMSVLEAFACGVPVMLRDLSLYHAIINNRYIPTADVTEMATQLARVAADPSALAPWRAQAVEAAQYYSEDRLAGIWSKFYTTQAALGQRTRRRTP
ncbi:glycosyltransferase [Schleiferilactobacillus harbinensis]|uniref:Glycosyltransferase n=1 Tax=Schleiferilactobacillus harbinensis DSM 16991 TaxID=1122147 RepID=A0A0R1X6Y2_9LACO|nr:glycosyltransferase family 4 protein [Schleiferilactobacillus harbinensis]KRM23593.1 glycosyltransferase [Schleiferilactobacillus harbinensis DSM 16991]MCT2907959.1 glycosyltransferase [Schleiferilactobacillus harbinensis]QFR64525.1 glycosyltransferase [Schleiferilactobacillus harbinensis]GEK07303.1 glycosyl transferase [Schleiferilactobacillus harbinensis]